MKPTLEAILMARARAKAKDVEKVKEVKAKVARAKETRIDGTPVTEPKVVVTKILMQEEHLKQEEAGAYLVEFLMMTDAHGHAH